jgi:ARG/rhodanese/phosphatase superfamily protein
MDKQRRDFLRICAVATATAASTAAPAWATRIRVLEDVSDPDRIVAVGQSNQHFRRFIGNVRAGQTRRHGALTVLWLHAGETGPALDVATLDEARAQGILVVTERAQASVPELLVENRAKVHVLLLAGEILVGGKQNRVLKEDVLLPPLSGVRNLGVYCVEQGRWNTGRTDFESKSTLAAPSLRSRLMEKADQAQVWSEVMRSARAAQSSSPTGSYQEIYETPEVKEHLKDVEHGISVTPPAGALGAAVFVGTGMAGLDLFQPGSLFAREWPKLLRAYAMEAYRQAPQLAEESKLHRSVKEVLESAAGAEGNLRGNAGVGHVFEFAAETRRGAALLFEARVLHAAIL